MVVLLVWYQGFLSGWEGWQWACHCSLAAKAGSGLGIGVCCLAGKADISVSCAGTSSTCHWGNSRITDLLVSWKTGCSGEPSDQADGRSLSIGRASVGPQVVSGDAIEIENQRKMKDLLLC